jgi:hypothetical protein
MFSIHKVLIGIFDPILLKVEHSYVLSKLSKVA